MGPNYKKFLHQQVVYRGVHQFYPDGRPMMTQMQHDDIRKVLGAPSPLPKEYSVRGYVNGVHVYIVPANSRGERWHHRTFVLCPCCGKEFTTGCIHQHLRTMHKDY